MREEVAERRVQEIDNRDGCFGLALHDDADGIALSKVQQLAAWPVWMQFGRLAQATPAATGQMCNFIT